MSGFHRGWRLGLLAAFGGFPSQLQTTWQMAAAWTAVSGLGRGWSSEALLGTLSGVLWWGDPF